LRIWWDGNVTAHFTPAEPAKLERGI